MLKLYIILVREGIKNIDKVPEKYRDDVEKALNPEEGDE